MYNQREYLSNIRDCKRSESRIKEIVYILAIITLTLVWAPSARAQIDSLRAGDRIRVYVPSLSRGRIIGTVSGITPTAVKLVTKQSTMIIPRRSVEQLSVSRGRRSNFGRFALIGAAAGGLTMGLAAMASNAPPDPCESEEFICFRIEFTDGEAFVLGAIAGTLAGAATGAVIGLLTKSDRWEERPLKVSLGLAPAYRDDLVVNPSVTLRLSLN